MLTIYGGKLAFDGMSLQSDNIYGLAGLAAITFGGLLAFLCYNGFPAKIFMGDTGSLALGGLMASLFAFSGQILLIFVLGIMLILTCVSVIVQVIYFKLTKGKRVWLMTPLQLMISIFLRRASFSNSQSNSTEGLMQTSPTSSSASSMLIPLLLITPSCTSICV